MSGERIAPEAIESPCIRLCTIDPATRLCIGCHRSMEEIGRWAAMTPQARRAVMDALPSRAAARIAPGTPGPD